MSIENKDRQAFEAINAVKKDAVLLSADEDITCDAGKIKEFIKGYHEFLDKYENSTNTKIRKFAEEIKRIVFDFEDKLNASGIWVDNSGRLSLKAGDENESDFAQKTGDGKEYSEAEEAFRIINKALLSAEVNMERFIPNKYINYDANKEYRVLQQTGNIYSEDV